MIYPMQNAGCRQRENASYHGGFGGRVCWTRPKTQIYTHIRTHEGEMLEYV